MDVLLLIRKSAREGKRPGSVRSNRLNYTTAVCLAWECCVQRGKTTGCFFGGGRSLDGSRDIEGSVPRTTHCDCPQQVTSGAN